MSPPLFDTWTEKYDSWFTTPVGRQVKYFESRLLLELLNPEPGDHLLDAGCGTGIFTQDIICRGSQVIGVDISRPMLEIACRRLPRHTFLGMVADMTELPFADNHFDRTFSMTAIEFVADAARAISEIERVTRPGGTMVVTTLNSLSPWAVQWCQKAAEGHDLFSRIKFRSPMELRELIGENCTIRTAIHFSKETQLEDIPMLECLPADALSETGAFLAAMWKKEDTRS